MKFTSEILYEIQWVQMHIAIKILIILIKILLYIISN
jgi:hypothetical protein